MNSFGMLYRLTSFGESHGPAIGGVIDGIEPGIPIDIARVQQQLARRRPGQSAVSTQRSEADQVEVLSGLMDGVTTGTPIGFVIRNTDHRSADYGEMQHLLRPSHADYAYLARYGLRDYRGGGRSSARETAVRVVGGAFAMQALERIGVTVQAYASQIGQVKLKTPYTQLDIALAEGSAVRCPDPESARLMEQAVLQAKAEGDTLGGVVTCVARGVPAGLGSPVYGKLQAQLAAAMMGINAAKGFEYGMGFAGAAMRGSETIDRWLPASEPAEGLPRLRTATNHSGGIQGGISNGEDIYFRVAFKPVATLMCDIDTVGLDGRPATLHARGRHDPCVVPRAVPVVEAMAAMVLYDAWLCRLR